MSTLIRHLPWFIAGLIVTILLLVIAQVVTSLPPQGLTILTGPVSGGYYKAALRYQKLAQEKGFDLQLRPTAGASEALDLLEQGEGDAALMQGGIARRGDAGSLRTIANVFYEPVWIFYRQAAFGDQPLKWLSQARGKRIALGPTGSGTRELAGTLAAQAGLTPANATLLEASYDEAAAQLAAGEIDVAFFVLADTSDLPWRLIAAPGVELMDMARAGAYAFHYPWLQELVLPEGGADVAQGLPREPKHLLGTTASLIARADLHPDLVRLLVAAAVATHRDGGRFEEPGQFPNQQLTDLPVLPEAEAYLRELERGPAYFDRFLPFWLASVIDRYVLFVIPALLILVPLLMRSPLVFQWYMRQRIVRWYRIVQDIERRAQGLSVSEIDAELANLNALEQRISEELVVTPTFIPQVYQLRQHIIFVADKLKERKAALEAGDSPAPPEAEENQPTSGRRKAPSAAIANA